MFSLRLTAPIVAALIAAPAFALELKETPTLTDKVTAGELPPVAERVPATPRVVEPTGIGTHGGDLRILMSRARDTRMMSVYGYARLVAYDPDLNLVPDILESFDVEEGRIFTLTLREGHKWSDGHPFTAEDFRYYWENIAQNEELAPFGPPPVFRVEGELPRFEVVDERTVRYSWTNPNPFFLSKLASPRPDFIYRPAHFLKQFHGEFADPATLDALIKKRRLRSWAPLHNAMDNLYRNDNPELPTLDPWVNTVRPPAQQFVFVRNPYFHRVDVEGQQLPYIDRVLMNIADGKLIPAKAGAGETDLQARNLFMSNYTFLRQSEEREGYRTLLWSAARGAQIALFPNMHHEDPVWRELFRDRRFRRALSLGIDRDEINDVIYFGLALPANNTVMPESPLFNDEYQTRWTEFDPDLANELLDEIGLTERDADGVRLLPDGRLLEIVVETAGDSTEQVDVLQLVHDTWLNELGVKIFTRPSQTEVFRNRIFAGQTQMAAAPGADNAIATAAMSPSDFVPIQQIHYQWPKWGQYFETDGKAGEAPDMPAGIELLDLYNSWRRADTDGQRAEIWDRILDVYTDEVFSIGIVCCTRQPVVVSESLQNIPEEGIYSWDPGAHFGIYLPDTFYFSDTPG